MSHDLRTPLTGIMGMAGIFGTQCAKSRRKKKRTAHMLYSSGEQLLHLLNSVLGVVALDNPQHGECRRRNLQHQQTLRGLAVLELPAMMLKNIV